MHLLQHIFATQFSIFLPTHPYKNRSPQPITPSRFSPLYRTSSPFIAVLKALPWQMKSTFIIVLFLLNLLRDELFCKGFRDFQFSLSKCRMLQNSAKKSKLLPPLSSKREMFTTKRYFDLSLLVHEA